MSLSLVSLDNHHTSFDGWTYENTDFARITYAITHTTHHGGCILLYNQFPNKTNTFFIPSFSKKFKIPQNTNFVKLRFDYRRVISGRENLERLNTVFVTVYDMDRNVLLHSEIFRGSTVSAIHQNTGATSYDSGWQHQELSLTIPNKEIKVNISLIDYNQPNIRNKLYLDNLFILRTAIPGELHHLEDIHPRKGVPLGK